MVGGSASAPALVPAPPRIPAPAVRKLGLILDRLAADGRLQRCADTYAEAPGENVSVGLRALGLDYLGEASDDAQALSGQLSPGVERWGRHREFAVHRLLEAERRLCVAVFERRPDDASPCFAEVAARAGVVDFASSPLLRRCSSRSGHVSSPVSSS